MTMTGTLALLALLLHAILAVLLLGAVTHQALAIGGNHFDKSSFFKRFRSVDAAGYSTAIVVLFAATSLIGALLYPQYRLIVRPFLENADLRAANGAFEIKEQFAAIGLGMLPAYWACWKRPLLPEYSTARQGMTWLLAAITWWNFSVGHILNGIRGLFQ